MSRVHDRDLDPVSRAGRLEHVHTAQVYVRTARRRDGDRGTAALCGHTVVGLPDSPSTFFR